MKLWSIRLIVRIYNAGGEGVAGGRLAKARVGEPSKARRGADRTSAPDSRPGTACLSAVVYRPMRPQRSGRKRCTLPDCSFQLYKSTLYSDEPKLYCTKKVAEPSADPKAPYSFSRSTTTLPFCFPFRIKAISSLSSASPISLCNESS